MRGKFTRVLCVGILYLVPHLMLPGCSSSEETTAEDGDLEAEASNGETENGSGDETASNEVENEFEGEDAAAADSENSGNELANGGSEESSENVLGSNQTNSDLENIVAGQDGDAAAAPADTAAAEQQPTEDISSAEVPPPAEAAPVADAAPAAATPAAAPMAPALPEPGSKMPYIVRMGESMSAIAQKIYGSTDKWTEMAELSSISNANLVKPGDVVYYQLTEQTLAFATAYEGAARVEVTVQAGDSLSTIAERVYGNSGDWKVIWRQNGNIDNPDSLTVGQTLYYLNPANLASAIDYARSVKVATLIKMNFGKKDPKAKAVQTTKSVKVAKAKTVQTNSNAQTSAQVTGFEIAQSMFSHFVTTLPILG